MMSEELDTAVLDVDARIDALAAALDEVIAGGQGDFRRRKKKRKKPDAPELKSVHISLVMRALTEAAERTAGGGPRQVGATARVRPEHQRLQQCRGVAFGLSWYQLKDATRLSDEILGLALSELLPVEVRCRGTGDDRIYFLPAGGRAKVRRKQGERRSNAA